MKKAKKENIVTVCVFLLLIFFFATMFWVVEDVEFSDEENRVLKSFPEFSLSRLLSGEFSKEMNVYFADQFPFRDAFVGAKGIAETILLKRENNGVVLLSGGSVAVRDMYSVEGGSVDFFNEEKMNAIGDIVASFSKNLTDNGIENVILLPPRTVDVMKSKLPSLFPSYRTEAAFDILSKKLENSSYVDLLPIYREKFENGEYVYFNTDHHWTTLGAYYAYVEIMRSFGMEYYTLEEFERETVSDAFFGTTWSRSGFKFVKPDTIEFFHLIGEDETKYTTKIFDRTYTKGDFAGFYDRDYLETKDKYSAFISGSNAHTEITKNGSEEREKLLLLKDSFGHSVAPFLALHFDLVIVDINYSSSLGEYFKDGTIDKVAVVYNMENIISSDNIGKLRVNVAPAKEN